jgi:hypothetical protein
MNRDELIVDALNCGLSESLHINFQEFIEVGDAREFGTCRDNVADVPESLRQGCQKVASLKISASP